MASLYDLHAHSTASDGTLTPTAVVERAHAQGVTVFGLTDHDVTHGLTEASVRAGQLGLGFIPGIEVSVTWSHQTIHVVGLGIQADDAVLLAGLEKLHDFRQWRAEEIGRRLQKAGIEGAFEAARARAKGKIISRTHFAHFLVEAGHAKDMKQVFRRYLVRGKPGYVPGEWANLEQAVGWIRGAGGHPVIAHPARYPLSATRLRQLISEFKDLGGEAIEVVSGSHSRDDNQRIGVLTQQMGLYASCGSDFHGPENPYFDLGRIPALPEGCRPIWEAEHWRGAR